MLFEQISSDSLKRTGIFSFFQRKRVRAMDQVMLQGSNGNECTGEPEACEEGSSTTESAAPCETSERVFSDLDIVGIILSYLGNTRDLYSFATTSKHYMSILKYEHAIQAAMQTRRTQRALAWLMPLIESRQIFVPSPIRLLRLVNGKRCECCKKNSVVYGENDSSRVGGVLFCQSCFQNYKGLLSCIDHVYIEHNRLATFGVEPFTQTVWSTFFGRGFLTTYVWTEPIRDSAGDRIGPILTQQQLSLLAAGHGEPSESKSIEQRVDQHLMELEDDANSRKVEAILNTYERCHK